MAQKQRQSGGFRTTAHIAQNMTILSMTSDELRERVYSDLADNPALELDEVAVCPMCRRRLPPGGQCSVCSQPQNLDSSEPVIFISPRDDFYLPHNSDPDANPMELYATENIDLATFVLRQIAMDLDPTELPIAIYLLTQLSDEGFLNIQIYNVCSYYHCLPDKVNGIIERLKRCEPIGVCSKDPQEALLTQIAFLAESQPIPPYTLEIVSRHFIALTQHRYAEVAKEMGIPKSTVQKVATFVSKNLNPYPAHADWGEAHNPAQSNPHVYHQPDILIYHFNNNPKYPLVVEIIQPIRGTLRVNQMFKDSLKEVKEDKSEQWRESIDKGTLLIKCIQQRSNALKLLFEKLMPYQTNYILYGNRALQPITRAQLAKELQMHESTISRAVSSKTVQLPNKKIVPLAIFFERNLAHRTIIKDMIAEESSALSDSEIQTRLFSEYNIDIARRTVAKYRSMEGILPAHLRQKQHKKVG